MQYKLVESISENSKITYYFVGFDDWRDFVKIMNIVKNNIKPDKSNYQGITDMNGYFKKDGLYIEVQYDEMIGNYLEFNGDKTDENLNRIKEWSEIIFDNLIISVEGENA